MNYSSVLLPDMKCWSVVVIKTEMRAILQLLAHFQTLALNEDISQLADSLIIEYALSHGMKPPDALIAATALHYESLLLSKNQKDFRYIVDFKLL